MSCAIRSFCFFFGVSGDIFCISFVSDVLFSVLGSAEVDFFGDFANPMDDDDDAPFKYFRNICLIAKERIWSSMGSVNVVDTEWAEYIHTISQLQREIQLQAYGQRDPLVEFNMQSYELFNNLVHDIQMKLLKSIFHIQFKVTLVEE